MAEYGTGRCVPWEVALLRIFLSAVSAQFKACRDALASDLRAIHCEVRVQEDFQQGPRTLIEQLEEYVAQCDRVIALTGDAYGGEASGVPADAPSRSYTQWEYFFALGEQLSKPRAAPKDLYVYFASAQLLGAYPVEQGDEERRRQASFVEGIKQSGKHWGSFDSVDQLCRLVLRDGWQMENRPSLPAAEPEPPELATLRVALTTDLAKVPDLDSASLQAILSHHPHTFSAYRLARVAEWSQPRYALDKRFTRLTLLLDQGADAQGTRWQAQSRSFQDLREVLAEVSEPAVVVLGPPGCGKSTLLRRLELDLAVDGLRAASGQAPLSLFLPLNRYRPYRPGEAVPAPEEWLAQEWQRRYPGLPELPELLRTERLLLLLDAVNEMPHADEADYRDRIARWKDFLADLTRRAPGTRVVFSCRSLDYSAPLSTPDLPVPHVRIERLADEQVEEFLAVYSTDLGPALWRQLRGTEQLDLFRSPFYLKLLLAQTERDGAPPRDRAALFTGFVRQALTREVEADNRLFRPGALLDARDRDRVVRREWRGPYDLPGRGSAISALCRLAFDLQARRGAGDVSRVRAPYEAALGLLGGDRPEDLLHAGVALQVLEEERDDVLFAHQLMQEYFAARTVAATPRPELVRTAWLASAAGVGAMHGTASSSLRAATRSSRTCVERHRRGSSLVATRWRASPT